MKTHTSIAQKIIYLSLTCQGLGLSVHKHLGLRVHVSWSAGTRTGSYRNCIVRRSLQSALWFEILRQLRRGGLTGLCRCVFGTIVGFDEKIGGACFQKEGEFSCRCQISFSLEIGNRYNISIFLSNGNMMLLEAPCSASGDC
jgi:hypothetical protein